MELRAGQHLATVLVAFEGVDVYVLDTGIMNADLNVVSNIDFVNPDAPDSRDVNGHGTHVAGVYRRHR